MNKGFYAQLCQLILRSNGIFAPGISFYFRKTPKSWGSSFSRLSISSKNSDSLPSSVSFCINAAFKSPLCSLDFLLVQSAKAQKCFE